jgi:TRAP-type C4-dicarboxylate transport system permease small subunit
VSEPRAGGTLAALERGFVAANQWAIILMMATMALLVFVNVVTRYVFNFSIIWVEELTQYQMIWITYLGAGLALREGRHVAVEVFQDRLPPRLRRHARTLVGLAMLAFLVTLAVLGFRIAQFTWNQETPVLNIPTGIPYLGVPIGALVMALHLVVVFRDYVDKRFEHVDPHEGEIA